MQGDLSEEGRRTLNVDGIKEQRKAGEMAHWLKCFSVLLLICLLMLINPL